MPYIRWRHWDWIDAETLVYNESFENNQIKYREFAQTVSEMASDWSVLRCAARTLHRHARVAAHRAAKSTRHTRPVYQCPTAHSSAAPGNKLARHQPQ